MYNIVYIHGQIVKHFISFMLCNSLHIITHIEILAGGHLSRIAFDIFCYHIIQTWKKIIEQKIQGWIYITLSSSIKFCDNSFIS